MAFFNAHELFGLETIAYEKWRYFVRGDVDPECPLIVILWQHVSNIQIREVKRLEAGYCPPDGREPPEEIYERCMPLIQFILSKRKIEEAETPPPLCSFVESIGPWEASWYHQVAEPVYCSDGVTVRNYVIRQIEGLPIT